MRRLFTLVFISVAPLLAQPNNKSQPMVLAITHVAVVDATGSPVSPDMTVVITGARITEMGKSEKVRFPKDARVIDGTGKFLIPGLWDRHANPFLVPQALPPQLLFNLYVANGVTGLRDPGGPLEVQLQWRKKVAAGEALGPRMIVSGSVLDGPYPWQPSVAIAISSEKDARSAVAALKQRGADFIKVYDFLPRAAYFAIVDEAKKQRIPMAGHIPISVTAAEASDASQRSVEHVIRLFESCSSIEAELQQEALRLVREATAAGRAPNFPVLYRELWQMELIRHTQKINAVVVNGRLLDRTALDDLLAKAATAFQNK